MKQPIIYIDVDGVLNFDAKNAFSFDKKATIDGYTLTVRLDRRHGQWLLDLAEKTGAELIWATTWMEHANYHIGPAIGLPELPYVDFGPRPYSMSSGTWKALGVIKHHDGRPFIWFDDDFTISDILQSEIMINHQLWLVREETGLTEKDIDYAYRWLKIL